MFTSPWHACLLTCLALALVQRPAMGAPLSSEELSKRGKAATALLEVGENSFATAFCVHPSGLFLTTGQGLRGDATGPITLVLGPGQKSEKIVQAKPVRRDGGLVLVRAEGEAKYPVLPLASDEGLTELMKVAVFGYPSRVVPRPAKGEYPPISVRLASVKSLARRQGELVNIQLDTALNPGNEGGPALDAEGRVIGMVAAHGKAPDLLVPAGRITRFLERPDFQLTPPSLDRTNLHKPLTYQARVLPLLPGPAPEVFLALAAPGAKERRHKMELVEGMYRATAAVLPGRDEPLLQLQVGFPDGAVTALAADRAFKVGGQEVRLSQVARLRFRPKGQAVLTDGKTIDGDISGLEKLDVQIDQKVVPLDLSKADEARVEAYAGAAFVAAALVAVQGGREVGRLDVVLPVRDGGRPHVRGLSIKPPTLDRDRLVVDLPSTVTDVVVGGGGRYLILHLPKERQLAVFDVNAAKVVGSVPLPEDKGLYAAGLNKLLVVLPQNNTVQRWSLATLEREASAELPYKGPPEQAVVGSASDGPLLLAGLLGIVDVQFNGLGLLDVATLKPLKMRPEPSVKVAYRQGTALRASADGNVIGRVREGHYQDAWQLLKLVPAGEEVTVVLDKRAHGIPGPDGRVFYPLHRGPLTEQGQLLRPAQAGPRSCLPATHGDFYLDLHRTGIAPASKPQGRGVSVFRVGHDQPLLNLPDIDISTWPVEKPLNKDVFIPIDKRIHLIPDAGVIVTVPPGKDQLVVHRADVYGALARPGQNFLMVLSRPPLTARPGELYTYRAAVESGAGGVEYRLESGPAGMAVTGTGTLTWPVPGDYARSQTDVVLRIRDAGGQEALQSFTIRLAN